METLSYFSTIKESLFDPSWHAFFEKESQKEYFLALVDFLMSQEARKLAIYPPKHLIFNAFKQVPLSEIKVVILGQDPYHGPGQAHGLCFSVSQGVAPPPSLKNIFKELSSDLKLPVPQHGCLLSWAHQGVFLLNTILTVQEGQPMSHHKQGWEIFTDHVIQEIASQPRPIVFMLWGKAAQEKYFHLVGSQTSKNHLVLQTTHPSPFSAHYGFLGSGHFSKANEFLKSNNCEPIDWSIS